MSLDLVSPPPYSAYLDSSPSTKGTPITPTSDSTSESFADPIAALDLFDLCNAEAIGMTPPIKAGLHHAPSYTYSAPVEGQYLNGVSQERSTVSPAHPYPTPAVDRHLWQTPNLPVTTPGAFRNGILRPFKDPRDNRGADAWTYQSHHPALPFAYPMYQNRAPSFHRHHDHDSHQTHSTSSNGTDLISTPSSIYNGYNYYHPSTIQPSAFQGWQTPDHDSRTRSNTISSSLLPGEETAARSIERSMSSPIPGNRDKMRWEKPMTSPSGSEQQSETDTEEMQLYISYVTDADVKQTPETRRMCFNCESTEAPSWRKSLIAPGKILCNKCGIYERTHNRVRPVQAEGKLRKAPYTIRRATMNEKYDEESPLPSPYSSVPSQDNPLSATTQFTYPIPPLVPHKTNPNQPLLSASALPERRHHLWVYSSASYAHDQHKPYAHAYAQRRALSYNTASNRKSVHNDIASSSGGSICHQGRRHSDGEDFDGQ